MTDNSTPTNATDLDRDRAVSVVEGLLLDTSPYLSCDECFEKVDHYVEQILADPSHQDIPMQVHLSGCGVCSEEAEALLELLSSTR